MENKKYPIIANGESYIQPIIKSGAGGDKKTPHEYEAAKIKLIADINNVINIIDEKQEFFLEEKIICIRLEPKFEAKSYIPDQLLVSNDMKFVGGRKYRLKNKTNADESAKLYFVRANATSINNLKNTLINGTKDQIAVWKKQIESIHSFDLLSSEEKILGFDENWKLGQVEIVLHPLMKEQEEVLNAFYSQSKIPRENTRIKKFDDGLTFISAQCTIQEIESLKNFNPLRAIHPLECVSLPILRSAMSSAAPIIEQQSEQQSQKPTITIGVFDGGVNSAVPLLSGYVQSTDCVSTNANPNYLCHGTAVCGVVLHGNLAAKNSNNTIPAPSVLVESFRVLPIQDRIDIELYESIEAIEKIVEERKDIKLYNISFGPKGAILDDSINLFTYTLDRLAFNVPENEDNPLFCIAVGNDGCLEPPLNRIQSPSDMVNGLGVGSYTYTATKEKTPALYSCVGHGREGAKIKPDLLEFGGDSICPFILTGAEENTVIHSSGTSFAAPLAAHKIGKLMAESNNITPHIGRALLIHSANSEQNSLETKIGHGYSEENIENILMCNDKKVTILYKGELSSKDTVKLPIFAPGINKTKGKVQVTWTIVAIVPPFVNDPDAYTSNCIEDVFVPHSQIYRFSKRESNGNQKITTINTSDPEKEETIEELLRNRYKKSSQPVTKSNNSSENTRRARDYKWDTVIKKSQIMKASSLNDPFITLQTIGRNDDCEKKIQYRVVVTIEALQYDGSLYNAVLQTYRNLNPIKVRNQQHIQVNI